MADRGEAIRVSAAYERARAEGLGLVEAMGVALELRDSVQDPPAGQHGRFIGAMWDPSDWPKERKARERAQEPSVQVSDEMAKRFHDTLRAEGWNDLHSWDETGENVRATCRAALAAALAAALESRCLR